MVFFFIKRLASAFWLKCNLYRVNKRRPRSCYCHQIVYLRIYCHQLLSSPLKASLLIASTSFLASSSVTGELPPKTIMIHSFNAPIFLYILLQKTHSIKLLLPSELKINICLENIIIRWTESSTCGGPTKHSIQYCCPAMQCRIGGRADNIQYRVIAQLIRFWVCFLNIINSSFINFRITRNLHGH